jgi:hypothetical protein
MQKIIFKIFYQIIKINDVYKKIMFFSTLFFSFLRFIKYPIYIAINSDTSLSTIKKGNLLRLTLVVPKKNSAWLVWLSLLLLVLLLAVTKVPSEVLE